LDADIEKGKSKSRRFGLGHVQLLGGTGGRERQQKGGRDEDDESRG
jgi:hypothetical protein